MRILVCFTLFLFMQKKYVNKELVSWSICLLNCTKHSVLMWMMNEGMANKLGEPYFYNCQTVQKKIMGPSKYTLLEVNFFL